MQIADIASMILETERIPVYYNDTRTFSAVTYLKPNAENQRGMYLPNCNSFEALEYCKTCTPDAFKRIKEMICTKCEFDNISFSVFSILHEWGHWIQYTDFIDKGYNDMQFIFFYESERGYLFEQRNIEYQNCKSKEDIIELNKKYDRLYAELPTEKHADDFALNHLLEYVTKIKLCKNSK